MLDRLSGPLRRLTESGRVLLKGGDTNLSQVCFDKFKKKKRIALFLSFPQVDF
jgi:hypothetical protein